MVTPTAAELQAQGLSTEKPVDGVVKYDAPYSKKKENEEVITSLFTFTGRDRDFIPNSEIKKAIVTAGIHWSLQAVNSFLIKDPRNGCVKETKNNQRGLVGLKFKA